MDTKPEIKTRKKRIIVAAVLATMMLLYFLIDPAKAVWMPKCPVHALTGFNCPGCGSQRLIHSLLHLDLAGAWRANAMLLLLLPYLLLMIVVELFPSMFPRLRSAMNSVPAVIAICAVFILWTILRNIIGI